MCNLPNFSLNCAFRETTICTICARTCVCVWGGGVVIMYSYAKVKRKLDRYMVALKFLYMNIEFSCVKYKLKNNEDHFVGSAPPFFRKFKVQGLLSAEHARLDFDKGR